MRIIYMGTPEFAVAPLKALIAAGHEIAAVVTQPDRPSGRGMKTLLPPVKECALSHGIPVYQPETLRGYALRPMLESEKPDLIAVAAYGKLLAPYVLNSPPAGCVNVHASLLPKYRGAAPIQYAILRGETETGVTIMHMARELDAGDMIISESTPIKKGETAGELTVRLSEIGAGLLVRTAEMLCDGSAPRTAQDHALATFAPSVSREDARIIWNRGSIEIVNLVRAMTPAPGAFTTHGGLNYKLAEAEPFQARGEPGVVLGIIRGKLAVACGEGSVLIAKIQTPGSRMMAAGDYARGHALPERFE